MSHSNIPAIRTARKLFVVFAICMFTIIALGTWFCVSSGLPRVMFDHVLLYMLADIVLLSAVMRLVGISSTTGSTIVPVALIAVRTVVSAPLGVSLLWAPQLFHGNALLSVVVVLWALNKVWLLYRAFQNPFAASKARERFMANVEAEQRAAEMAKSPEEKERERKLFEEELMKVAQQVMAQDAYMAAHPGATREEARKATGTNED
ncbi:hypothetical protein KDX23_07445 [Burkholderia vietnamiensis]|uniref:hypothetical protein n=1 Tax=Burkholderia vietnamiensis TaxID=60552 RepID=UPI001B936924|nr:hypothetical protein [Burkholderia vietnamiensis]MBR8082578.1 hypothetical protein [Burkholderia vietnamiensis]